MRIRDWSSDVCSSDLLCRMALDPQVTMLGFAGSPWTVATYMVAGEGSRDQHETRALAYRDPVLFQAIVDAITDVTITSLRGQIDAGAEAVQLFDSWAGRTEERRVGKGCVRTCRSRWSP